MPSPTCYLTLKLKSTLNKLTTKPYGLHNKKNVLVNLNTELKKFRLVMPLSKKPLKH